MLAFHSTSAVVEQLLPSDGHAVCVASLQEEDCTSARTQTSHVCTFTVGVMEIMRKRGMPEWKFILAPLPLVCTCAGGCVSWPKARGRN